jgi:hypothetical protein
MTRRTQTERSDATIAQLIAAAQRLFGQDGYAATSIDAVTAAAGVTKGAAWTRRSGRSCCWTGRPCSAGNGSARSSATTPCAS